MPAVSAILPSSLTPAYISKMIGLYSKGKDSLRSEYTYYMDEAMKNPELAIQLLNNRYFYSLVSEWLNQDQKEMVNQLKPYLILVLQALKNPQVRKSLDWALVKEDARLVRKAVKGIDRELENLSKEILNETEKNK